MAIAPLAKLAQPDTLVPPTATPSADGTSFAAMLGGVVPPVAAEGATPPAVPATKPARARTDPTDATGTLAGLMTVPIVPLPTPSEAPAPAPTVRPRAADATATAAPIAAAQTAADSGAALAMASPAQPAPLSAEEMAALAPALQMLVEHAASTPVAASAPALPSAGATVATNADAAVRPMIPVDPRAAVPAVVPSAVDATPTVTAVLSPANDPVARDMVAQPQSAAAMPPAGPDTATILSARVGVRTAVPARAVAAATPAAAIAATPAAAAAPVVASPIMPALVADPAKGQGTPVVTTADPVRTAPVQTAVQGLSRQDAPALVASVSAAPTPAAPTPVSVATAAPARSAPTPSPSNQAAAPSIAAASRAPAPSAPTRPQPMPAAPVVAAQPRMASSDDRALPGSVARKTDKIDKSDKSDKADTAAASVDGTTPALASAAPATTATTTSTTIAPQSALIDTAGQQLAQGGADRALDLAKGNAWLDGISRDIAATGANSGTLSFQVAPQQLGLVSVALKQGEDGAAVTITAASEKARDLIADARPQLIAEAQASGIRIASAQVDVSSQQQSSSDQQRGQGGHASHQQTAQQPAQGDGKGFSAQSGMSDGNNRSSAQTRYQPVSDSPLANPFHGGAVAESADDAAPATGLYA